MSKHTILTNKEIEEFKVSKRITSLLDQICKHLNKKKRQLRVLDWGCGRGKTVGKLLKLGYNAYGIDIDEVTIFNGKPWFDNNGYPFDRILCVKANKKLPFEDGYFDVVLTEQVLEHVDNIENVFLEMDRISNSNSVTIHTFPAKWRIQEPHLFMPFVHWLPKNILRKWLILFFTFLGKEPRPLWADNEGNKVSRVKKYYDYSIKKTYYRSFPKIKNILENNNFSVKITPFYPQLEFKKSKIKIINFTSIKRDKGFMFWKFVVRKLYCFYITNFNSVSITTTRK
ncbi:MAG: class I SAM-dependent methyltransferase [Verrucomicrobiota bacterium]|nr:class I SAM-dependent methyltransferase [Verrucomicrobiota bacterium]